MARLDWLVKRLDQGSDRKAPRPSSSDETETSDKDTPGSHSAQKPRQLPDAYSGRGVSDDFINDARRDMQMRKMKYDEADFKWLREARTQIYMMGLKHTELATEHKALTTELNRIFQLAAAAVQKPKTKRKKAKGAAKKEEDADQAATSESLPASAEDEDRAKTAMEEAHEKAAQLRDRAKQVKAELAPLIKQLEDMRERSLQIRMSWPNHCHPDVPIGPEENAVVMSVQDPLNLLPTEFDAMKESWNKSAIQIKDFPEGPPPDKKRDHLRVANYARNAEVDTISGLLATGSSWPYLLGSISLLEHALTQYAMSKVVSKGFLAVSPPDVVRAELADRCGFRPRDEKAKQTYFLEGISRRQLKKEASAKNGEEEESFLNGELCLAATAEIPLAGLLAGRLFEPFRKSKRHGYLNKISEGLIQDSDLPIKLAALGHSFRAEAGARGADTRGLYRVHQFSKVEMFVAMKSFRDKSDAMLEELRGIQEEVIGGLGLPYRVLDMPTEELGASAYRKYDIEVWMPGRGSWGEVSSASNCTVYQALRLGIKQKRAPPMSSATSTDDSTTDEASDGASDGASDKTSVKASVKASDKASDKAPDSSPDKASPTLPSGSGGRTLHTLNATAAAIPRLIVAILENHGVEKGRLVLPDTLKPFWLAGEHDRNVTWLHTGKLKRRPRSRLQRALMRVRSIAKRNGTDAPTMVASFLILHELTALVPLVVLFYVFGALGVGTAVLQWLLGDSEPSAEDESMAARLRAWARRKEERFERYCRKNGYLGFEKQDAETMEQAQKVGDTSRVAASFANMVAAYILVKALIPLRIGASVALAAPFSRTVLEPLKGVTRRIFRRRATPTRA
ncbi:related to mitochondrial seryl-tRNA synthetases [Moesziomyces antarcticus]|uniref:serine--tRNA ligase n=1 Tax=Pseudozyma antarctica TaxID=84753 RepID=A0A5C3FS00_PSEA2|nr:related to mitochondrial seryl-tRNA synthetases [Moesziomyces antarcticus]